MRIVITGGGGYIGSVMTGMMLEKGWNVTVVDRFFFGDTLAQHRANPRLTIVRDDVRSVPKDVFKNVDGVCDLAALSNDPAGELNPQKTLDINHKGRARVAKLAKEAGVKRYVLASSCSIYGFQDEVVTEASKINPLTTYAEANGLAEQSNLPLGDSTFTATAVRQATVYGLSPRMRFDLAINGMTRALHQQGSVKIMRDGTQWRPFVHVRDTVRAFMTVLQADPSKVNREIFNVGSKDQNVQILPLARRVSESVGIPFQEDWYGDPDHRSYRVSFEKIERTLGYKTQLQPEDGAKEIFAALKSGALAADDPRTNTLGWYKTLIQWNDTIQGVAQDGHIL